MLPITQVVQIVSMVLAQLNIAPAVQKFADSLVAQLPAIEAAGEDVLNYFSEQWAKVQSMITENRDPTEKEWNALAAEEQGEMDKLHAQKSAD